MTNPVSITPCQTFAAVFCFAGFAAGLAGCETNPPSLLSPVPNASGRIFVQASVDSASISLDNAPTGRFTPDTISAAVGTHLLRLDKPGFFAATQTVRVGMDSLTTVICTLVPHLAEKVVLIEDFSNVSCTPCVLSNLVLHSLEGGVFSGNKVAIVKYATNFPSPSDPFYIADQADCDARLSYYSILFAPTIIVDGIARPTPTDSVALKDTVNVHLQRVPAISVAVAQTLFGGILSASVAVTPLDTTGIPFADLVLHTVVTEANVTYASPPGSNGETTFYHITRIMLPSCNGQSLTAQNRTGTVIYQRQTPIAPAWSVGNIRVIAFIQNRTTGIVLQAGAAR